jgi:hypothetical protein
MSYDSYIYVCVCVCVYVFCCHKESRDSTYPHLKMPRMSLETSSLERVFFGSGATKIQFLRLFTYFITPYQIL